MIYKTHSSKLFYSSMLLAFTFACSNVFAHGGGGGDTHKEKPKVIQVMPRQAPAVPKALSNLDLAKIMSKEKSPSDVAVIQCTLYGYAKCRGLEIALYDLKGGLVVAANTGAEGVVGFEGLKEGQKYEARLEASKYKGSLVVTSGGAWLLKVD